MLNKNQLYEDALKAEERILNTNPSVSPGDPTLPVSQFLANEQLEQLERNFQEDKFCLLQAIALCAAHGIPIPEWAARAYLEGFRKITSANDKSLDNVFGSPYPKGTHISALRKKRKYKYRVYFEVVSVLQKHPDLAIDDYLFEQVGRKFGLGKTLSSEYYYEVKEMMKTNSKGQLMLISASKPSRSVK